VLKACYQVKNLLRTERERLFFGLWELEVDTFTQSAGGTNVGLWAQSI